MEKPKLDYVDNECWRQLAAVSYIMITSKRKFIEDSLSRIIVLEVAKGECRGVS